MSIPTDTRPWAWHVHHGRLYEKSSGLDKRRNYIQKAKPYKERARRLRLLKLVQEQDLLTTLNNSYCIVTFASLPASQRTTLRRAIQNIITKLHQIECPKCPWNGKTIFPKKAK